MRLLKMDILLLIPLMTGSVLSHVVNTRGILANNSVEFRTSPTDEITTLINPTGFVRHMEPDLHKAGNILFSEGYALRTTDGETATTIAGSPSSRANIVALGQLARFGYMTGFRQISSTHVVVVDLTHSCLRLVDRLTLETPWYAGNCDSSGYSQGTTTARFGHPWGIIDDKKRSDMLLVTDSYNDAIRHVQVTAGSGLGSVSEFYKSSTLDSPNGLTQDPISGDLFITTKGHKVFKLTYTTRSLLLLAGSSNGFLDGDFGSSRFANPKGIILIDNGRKLILTDKYNHRLRLLDLITLQTSSLCTGESGHSDGDMSSCTLIYPMSLMVLNNTLYVGESQRIRKIQDKLVTLCEERVEYVISPETGLALVKVPGPGGTTKLSLPPGTYPISLDYSSVNCTMMYHVSDHREDACPTPEIQETVNSDTGVAVVDVPLSGARTGEISLPPGSYPLRITSDNFNCTVEYNISDVLDTPNPCSDPVIRLTASPDTGVALVDMALSGAQGTMRLPPGNYYFDVRSNEESCTVNIIISDHRLRRRLVFQAQYDVQCETTTGNIAESPLTLIVAQHAFDYQEICSTDCTRPTSVDIEIFCTNHTLTVIWPSNQTYTGEVNKIPDGLDQRLTSRIVAECSALYLVLPEANPPIVFPEQEENGGYMRAELYSYCVGEDVRYVKSTDSCEQ